MFKRMCLGIAIIVGSAAPWLSLASADPLTACATHTSATRGCYAKLKSPLATAAPAGYGPSQLRAAYHAASGAAKIAIVDAYGDPTIKADLDTYSRAFGLPVLPTCSSSGQLACFEKIDQLGGQNYPATDKGWAVETALDVEAAHAVCPGCRLELVQAKTASTANLLAAVDRAVASGAQIVSLSWGGSESASETGYDAHFNHPSVVFVASSGDSGYGTSWPAASPQILAVGGTTLTATSAGRSTETAWSGAGSGCSRYEAKPSYQHDSGCGRRSIADVAADADPTTGAAVYTSTSTSGAGWLVVGGTSLAAPVVAGLIASAGPVNQATLQSRLYGSLGTNRLYDVASGTNGSCQTYFCHAGTGYDGPTGVGTPNSALAL